MCDKAKQLVLFNNVICKCFKNNKYPLQIYRDTTTSVFRDNKYIYLFPDYIMSEYKKFDIVNACSSVNPVIVPELRNTDDVISRYLPELLPLVETRLKPSYNMIINSHTDSPLELGIFVLKNVDDILVPLYSSEEMDSRIDEYMNYVGRSIATALENKISKYKSFIDDGIIKTKEEKTLMSKVKKFFHRPDSKEMYLSKFKYYYDYITDETGNGCSNRIDLVPIVSENMTNLVYKKLDQSTKELILPLTIIFTIY